MNNKNIVLGFVFPARVGTWRHDGLQGARGRPVAPNGRRVYGDSGRNETLQVAAASVRGNTRLPLWRKSVIQTVNLTTGREWRAPSVAFAHAAERQRARCTPGGVDTFCL